MHTVSTNRIYGCSTRSKPPHRAEAGFGATAGILLMASGALAMSLTALGAAEAYDDAVFHEELRIQADLNYRACTESAVLIKAKDAFETGPVVLPEFGCTISI